MEDDNVIDITDRGKLMGKMVEKDAVQLVEMGSSGKNYCLTLSKKSLIAIREGSSFPIEFMANGTKMKINVMRDTEFRKKMRIFNKANTMAKESAIATKEVNDAVGLGKSLGEQLDQ